MRALAIATTHKNTGDNTDNKDTSKSEDEEGTIQHLASLAKHKSPSTVDDNRLRSGPNQHKNRNRNEQQKAKTSKHKNTYGHIRQIHPTDKDWEEERLIQAQRLQEALNLHLRPP